MPTIPRHAAVLLGALLPLLCACSDRDTEGDIAKEPQAPPVGSVATDREQGVHVPSGGPPAAGGKAIDVAALTREPPAERRATVELEPVGDSKVSGTLLLVQSSDGVQISGRVMHIEPGKHGFHIHENRQCDDPGDHYSPDESRHGDPQKAEHHLGDLGNFDAGPDSEANLYMTSDDLKLQGEHSVAGRAIVVHRGEDDLKSQPSGNSGDIVACGLIELENKDRGKAATRDSAEDRDA